MKKTSPSRLAVVVGVLVLAVFILLTCPGCFYVGKNNVHQVSSQRMDTGSQTGDFGRVEKIQKTEAEIPLSGRGKAGFVQITKDTNTVFVSQANTAGGWHDRTVTTNYFQDTSWKAGCESPLKGLKGLVNINLLSGNRCGCGVSPCHHTAGYYTGGATYGTYYPPGALILNPGPSVHIRYPDQHSPVPGASPQCPPPRYVPYRR